MQISRLQHNFLHAGVTPDLITYSYVTGNFANIIEFWVLVCSWFQLTVPTRTLPAGGDKITSNLFWETGHLQQPRNAFKKRFWRIFKNKTWASGILSSLRRILKSGIINLAEMSFWFLVIGFPWLSIILLWGGKGYFL